MGNTIDVVTIIRPVKTVDEAISEILAFPFYKNIIVDLVAEDCVSFARKANAAKLLSGYYHYHFTTMVSVI